VTGEGYLDTANILPANGADVKVKDYDGNTTLILAVAEGRHLDTVQELLEKDDDVNAENKGVH
jgi:ankyrin repeat protein